MASSGFPIDPYTVFGHFITTSVSVYHEIVSLCLRFGITRLSICFCDFLKAWCIFVYEEEDFDVIQLHVLHNHLNCEVAHI